MLAAELRFEGFTAQDWVRVLSLFQPRRASGAQRDPERPRGGVVAVHAVGRLWKLVHTQVGRLRLDEAQRDWPLSAQELAHRHHASWGMTIESGALESIMDRFGARARRGDDLMVQAITVLRLALDELDAGRIDLWPRRLRGMPLPAANMVRGTLDMVCPVGKTLVIGLFEEGELWTSIALRRAADGIDLALGPDEVRGDMGLLSGDWRRDYRHLARAVEERCGPIALGCYTETSTFRALEVDPTPGAWAKAVTVRDVLLSPVPAPLAIPLGIDVGRAAVSMIRSFAERFDPLGVVAPSLDAVRDVVRGDRDVASVLGFHPLEALRRLLSRDT